MKNRSIWLIPTLVIVCCLVFNIVFDQYEIDSDIIDFMMFIVAVYGILFAAPCFYVVLIGVYSKSVKSFIRSIIYAFCCVMLNAIIVCYESLLYYLKVKERGVYDLDLLPMYIIIPSGIILIGLCIVLVLRRCKRKRQW